MSSLSPASPVPHPSSLSAPAAAPERVLFGPPVAFSQLAEEMARDFDFDVRIASNVPLDSYAGCAALVWMQESFTLSHEAMGAKLRAAVIERCEMHADQAITIEYNKAALAVMAAFLVAGLIAVGIMIHQENRTTSLPVPVPHAFETRAGEI